ncbi:unnamed protein product [Rotaria sordida]|uniref:Condensation domain-containing protein n=1 Tax=Rotaria sordida TaxID=392033 RepID=A0A814H4B8_9BILA|nr:unnamed protein product [Rotaria sordida]CAF1428379.1 unnamed protein product [Rotaria sordida]
MFFSNVQHHVSSKNNLFHLILYTNHCVSDGRSGYILINDFLTLATSSSLHEFSEPLNTEILPFIGQLIPRPYGSLYHIISFIGKHNLKRSLRNLRQSRVPVKSIPLTDCEQTTFHIQRHKIRFLFSSSSCNLYLDLHEQCRLHEVTLHGPLVSCFLLAIHHCFPLDDNNQLVPFEIEMEFDMRLRLPQSTLTSSSVGFFVGDSNFSLDRSLSIHSTRFWSLARLCMITTQKQLKRNGVPLSMNIFCDMMRDERLFNQITRLFPEGRMSEFIFSNIGKYPFSCDYNQGQIHLHGMHVINNGSVYHSSSTLYITCVGDNQLDFSLAHEMENEEKAKEFLDFYIHLIETCANRQRCQTETTIDQLLAMIK